MLTWGSSWVNALVGYAEVGLAAGILFGVQLYHLVWYVSPQLGMDKMVDLDLWRYAPWGLDTISGLYDGVSTAAISDIVFAYALYVPILKITLMILMASLSSIAWWPMDGIYRPKHPNAPHPALLRSNLFVFPLLAVDLVSSACLHAILVGIVDARSSGLDVTEHLASHPLLPTLALIGGLSSLLRNAILIFLSASSAVGLGILFVQDLKKTYKEEFKNMGKSTGGDAPVKRKSKSAQRRKVLRKRN